MLYARLYHSEYPIANINVIQAFSTFIYGYMASYKCIRYSILQQNTQGHLQSTHYIIVNSYNIQMVLWL